MNALLQTLAASALAAAAPAGPAVMTKAPAASPLKAYAPPPRVEYVLPNGLEVLLVLDRRQPLVTARLGVKQGSSLIAPKEAGILEALAELLTEGTRTKGSKEIADEADAIGGDIDASAAQDSLVLGASALSENLERMLELMREVALEPSFPEGEVTLRRQNMLAELEVNRSQPSFLASVAFSKKLYAGHPYAVTAPTEASIAGIKRERLAELHRRFLSPGLCVLVLVGDFEEAKARQALEKRFGPWPAAKAAPAVSGSTVPASHRIFLLDRPGSSQTDLKLGNIALTRTHPDYFPLLVLNGVLGGSFGSRLVQDIRETRGLAYRIGSRVAAQRELGAFVIGTQTKTESTEETLRAILEHIDRARTAPVSEEELNQAKSVLAGRFVRDLETQEGLADRFLDLKTHSLPQDWLEAFVPRIQAVTREEALEAARRHIRPDALTAVAVGDAARIERALSAFTPNPVQRVDLNGD